MNRTAPKLEWLDSGVDRLPPPADAVRLAGEAHDEPSARPLHRILEQMAAALARARGRFDGDLDSYLIYLVVAIGHLAAAPDWPAPAPDDCARRRIGINILSISDITRIPRETVRRKLTLMSAKNYLTRGEDNLYYISDELRLSEFLKDIDLVLHGPPRSAPGRGRA